MARTAEQLTLFDFRPEVFPRRSEHRGYGFSFRFWIDVIELKPLSFVAPDALAAKLFLAPGATELAILPDVCTHLGWGVGH